MTAFCSLAVASSWYSGCGGWVRIELTSYFVTLQFLKISETASDVRMNDFDVGVATTNCCPFERERETLSIFEWAETLVHLCIRVVSLVVDKLYFCISMLFCCSRFVRGSVFVFETISVGLAPVQH